MVTINYNGEELRLFQSTYCENDALYIGLADMNGEYYADVTVNLANSGTLPSDCAYIDGNNLPQIGQTLVQLGIATPTPQSARSGFVTYFAYRFNNISDIDDVSVAVS